MNFRFLRGAIFCRTGLLVSAFFVLLSGRSAQAQVVNIPDPDLEIKVREALGIPSPTNIYVTNMMTLTNFNAAFTSVHNLTGLEKAPNLQTLDVGFTQITNLAPVAGLTNLTEFHFAWSHVTSLAPLANLTNLVFLDAAGNRRPPDDASITNASVVAGMKKLRWLNIYFLRIQDLAPVQGLTLLTNLEVGWNGSPSNYTAAAGLTNLLRLGMQNIGVSNITFVAGLTNLRSLDIGFNPISSLTPIASMPLRELWIYYTQVTNAAVVTNTPSLQILSLGSVNLTNIPFVSKLTNLTDLAIDNNPGIQNFSPLL